MTTESEGEEYRVATICISKQGQRKSHVAEEGQ